MNPFSAYTRWLHTRWPAGKVESLPEVGENGATAVPGIRIVGDLSGIPLLKFSADTGARAVQAILAEPDFAGQRGQGGADMLDLAIIGAGVSGLAAAMEAKKAGLSFRIYEAAEPFSTIVNFPKAKPIYTYPTEMTPAGEVKFTTDVKEALLAELEQQRAAAGIEITKDRIDRLESRGSHIEVHHADQRVTKARRVVVAIGRSGNYRKLGVPGEELDKVSNRLYDPKEYSGKNVVVVGGGDSALETAIACTICGANVTLSYRAKEFARAKPENIEKVEQLVHDADAAVAVEDPKSERVNAAASHAMRESTPRGSLRVLLGSQIREITPDAVTFQLDGGKEEKVPNDSVFAMIGREAPLDFFRRSSIPIRGEWNALKIVACLAFIAVCWVIYHFKSNHPLEWGLQQWLGNNGYFPFNMESKIEAISEASKDPKTLLYTIKKGFGNPSFYYTLAYCTLVVVFGLRRIRRRPTPYVKWQTAALMFSQCVPLFILPEIILPYMGRNGLFSGDGWLKTVADHLFETYDNGVGVERAYWRSYGFILAWPLNVYNVFTPAPMWTWLIISFVQTFVIIPLIIWRWGKGAYCGWICSCGAMAETLGDTHRSKMPHGPVWNRLNMLGQVVLLFAFVILALRIVGWIRGPESWASHATHALFEGIPFLNYGWSVDIFLGGVLGIGLYFWFSGRTWCRFACPLAALMHIYARFSRFRIFPEKKKCISCNVCTSVCHQGIDIMSFANKGLPMEDPECVRCSACVQQCPTGVLSFGRFDKTGHPLLDKLLASPVQIREKAKH